VAAAAAAAAAVVVLFPIRREEVFIGNNKGKVEVVCVESRCASEVLWCCSQNLHCFAFVAVMNATKANGIEGAQTGVKQQN